METNIKKGLLKQTASFAPPSNSTVKWAKMGQSKQRDEPKIRRIYVLQGKESFEKPEHPQHSKMQRIQSENKGCK